MPVVNNKKLVVSIPPRVVNKVSANNPEISYLLFSLFDKYDQTMFETLQRAFQSNSTIKKVDISDSFCSPETLLRWLSIFSTIESLESFVCRNWSSSVQKSAYLPDSFFKGLKKFKNIAELNLSGNALSSKNVDDILTLPSLSRLFLERCSLGDRSLDVFSQAFSRNALAELKLMGSFARKETLQKWRSSLEDNTNLSVFDFQYFSWHELFRGLGLFFSLGSVPALLVLGLLGFSRPHDRDGLNKRASFYVLSPLFLLAVATYVFSSNRLSRNYKPLISEIQEIVRRNKEVDGFSLGRAQSIVPAIPPLIVKTDFVFIEYKDIHFIEGAVLGRGGYGIVSKARWQNIEVGVKKLLMNGLEKERLELFKSELKSHANLKHPNIVPLFGACIEEGHYCLVMDFMPNGSLRSFLDKQKELVWDLNLSIAKDVAIGLAYLHSRDILHCDLKSDNVLLDRNFRGRLSDFGLSVVKQEGSSQLLAAAPAGTLNWMAPELFEKGGRSTKSSDVYALGIVLWELCSGKVPHEGLSPPQIMNLVSQGIRDHVSEEFRVAHPEFSSLIERCWAQDPSQRPAAQDVVNSLVELLKPEEQVPSLGAASNGASFLPPPRQLDVNPIPAPPLHRNYQLFSQ